MLYIVQHNKKKSVFTNTRHTVENTHWTTEHLPTQHLTHHITKGLFKAVPFNQYVISTYEENLQDIL